MASHGAIDPKVALGARAAAPAERWGTNAPWSPEWCAFVWSSVPGAALATAASIGLVSESFALAIFALSFVGLNLMHMGATWARVYVRPSWRSNRLERLVLPVLLVVFALSYAAVGGGATLLAVQYFLSFHHGLMQNYGIVRASQRRGGRVVDPRLDLAACLLLPGAALLYRANAVSSEYSGATIPSVPGALPEAMACAGVVALLAFGWREWSAHRRGEQVDPIGIGMLFGTNLLWSALLVGNAHPAMPLFAFAAGHYAQYLYFVWTVEKREPLSGAETGLRTRLHASLRASHVQYLVLLLVMAGAVTLLLTFVSTGLRAVAVSMHWRPENALDLAPWAAAMLGVNLEHYWLDHRIWRTPRQAVAARAA